MIAVDLSSQEDYRHVLAPGEHEAIYFLFTTPDGDLFGILRLLFGHRDLLEMVALRVEGRTWVHQPTLIWDRLATPTPKAVGPHLSLTCHQPWVTWHVHFDHEVAAVDDPAVRRALSLDLTFQATIEPACYSYGPYHQAEQEGGLTGRVRLGEEMWEGEFICYRDHSWGRRPMRASTGWAIIVIPEKLYAAVVYMEGSNFYMGRAVTPTGDFAPVRELTLGDTSKGWALHVPALGPGALTLARLSSPISLYLGPAGHEAVRDQAAPGDLLHDQIGPARYTSPDGDRMIGFLEYARKEML
jgi:hypothetical protein